jgi:iron(III) transport system substrate-binding protein
MRPFVLAALLMMASLPAIAASLPDATQKAMAKLKLDPSAMDGIDDELRVPQSWLDQAKAEKRVVILGTWYDNQFRAMTAPFRERYPGVTLDFRRTGTAARGMRVLVALNEGRVTADILTSIVDAGPEFVKAKALADLRDVPNVRALPGEYVDGNGLWAAYARSYRCIAYNTTKVKADDLPKRWDDLLDNPRWRSGKLALSNHPNTWLLHLWASLGESWGERFTRGLFETVQPQRRTEGLSAVTSLTVAGEADANIPAPERRVSTLVSHDAPIGYHCPEPVPVTLSQIVVLEKSPHKAASKLFINWLLSREGQVMQYTEAYAVPVHNGLQSATFTPFADTIVGKPVSIRDEAMMNDALQEKMMKVWNGYWTGQ